MRFEEIFGWKSIGDSLFTDGASTLIINSHRFERAISVTGYKDRDLVLDIGSYPGFGLHFFKNYIATGLLPKEYIDKLNTHSIKNFTLNIEEEGFECDADLILFQEVIEHIRRPAFALKNIVSSLKPGARLYITTNNIYYYGYLIKLILGKRIYDDIQSEFDIYPGHHRYYALEELVDTLTGLGLRIDSAEHINLLPPVKFYNRRSLGIIKWLFSKITPKRYSSHIEILAVK